MTTPSSFFAPFSGSFPLSKTLRFALLPQGNTLANLQQHGILQHDNQRKKDYQTIKPLFDQLHEQFITDSLKESKIDWSEFFAFYQAYKPKSREGKEQYKAEFTSHLKNLREKVVQLYSTTAEKRKTTYLDTKGKPILTEKGYKILKEKRILEILEKKYAADNDKKNVINNFKGFFTYFSGFNQNRNNYYSSEEKSTSVAHRIVNENLLFFCDNALLEEKLSVLELTKEEKQIFNIEFYNQWLTQD
jgi:CRISPR-associated protein Cpf1